ncbi:DUF47 family protein [Candidatus Bathyarchaeota archaeon]|nr:DUF47 family protein [Candidatus Bathyarchaeota archaeon]
MRNLLMLCQDNARLIVEGFRKILSITDQISKNEGTSEGIIENIQNIIDESSKIKSTLIKELHEIGGVLLSRDDFFRLISALGDIMDHVKGIGARLTEIQQRKYVVPNDVGQSVNKLSDIAFDAMIKLREAMMSLGFNSEKAVSFTKEIDDLEKRFDEAYFRVELSVITSEMELPAILMLKDAIMLMEDMVDKIRDASDLIRIIAL